MRTRAVAKACRLRGQQLFRAAAVRAAGRPAQAARRGVAAVASGGGATPAQLPFTLKDVDVRVGDWGSLRIVVPASEDEVLDYYISAGKQESDPFFCSIWPSSIALAQNVLSKPSLVRGKRVIDIGCGLGCAGLGAALAGAAAVVLSDREPFALRCSLLAAQANGLFPASLDPGADGVSTDGERRLRAMLSSTAGAAGFGRVSALELDWFAPPAHLAGAFDVMLCADVLYDATAAAPVSALALHLLAPGGRLLLADPPLRTPANRARFFEALEGRLTLVQQEQQRVFDADAKPVDITWAVFERPSDAVSA